MDSVYKMNTRGKKIEFAEMLGSKITDKSGSKSAKTAKRRATSLDGGAKSVTPSSEKKSDCLPETVASHSQKSRLSYNGEDKKVPLKSDAELRAEVSGLGDCGISGAPMINIDEGENGCSTLGSRKVKASETTIKDDPSMEKSQISCDRKDECDESLIETKPTICDTSPVHLDGKDCNQADKPIEDSKISSPSGTLPDSGGGRSTRRNRPLDYKCLAGLRDYQRKRKILEEETTKGSSGSKVSTPKKASKKICLDPNERCSSVLDPCGEAIKMENNEIVEDNKQPNDGLFNDNISNPSLAGNTDVKPLDKIVLVAAAPREDATIEDDKKPIEASRPAVKIKLIKEKVRTDDSDVSGIRSDQTDSNKRNQSDCIGDINRNRSSKTDSTPPRYFVCSTSLSSATDVDVSDSKVPALTSKNVPRRPYDNAQLSSLICKIEARMNKLKNLTDISSENQVNIPPLARARGKKSDGFVSVQVKEENIAERDLEEALVKGANSRRCSPKIDDGDKKIPPLEFAESSGNFDRRSINTSSDCLPAEIGKTRLHARKSLALSLARAVSASEKTSLEDGRSLPHFKVSAGFNYSGDLPGQKDKARVNLRMKINRFAASSIPPENATAPEMCSTIAPTTQTVPITNQTELRKSVFTSPELDDYLASNSMRPFEKEEARPFYEPEVDEVEGFTFMAFTSRRALEDHMRRLNVEQDEFGRSSGIEPEATKPSFGYAEKDVQGLDRTPSSEELAACRAKQQALERSGKIRLFSTEELSDLGLVIGDSNYAVNSELCPDENACVGKVTRRGIGKMGNEKRQPRKGKIYGRKVTGRFASKANIKYYVKKRSPDSLTQVDPKNSNDVSGKPGSSRQIALARDKMLNSITDEDLMPMILTMKMAISAAKALRIESAAEKPCDQEDCTCVGRRGVQPSYEQEIQPSYEPEHSEEVLPPSSSSTECCREHCRLGCVCESVCSPQKRKHRGAHCGRPECMFDCHCDPAVRSLLQSPSISNSDTRPKNSCTRRLLDLTDSKERENASTSVSNVVAHVAGKRRKRRSWGIPLDDGAAVLEDATLKTDENGHLLRKSGRIKERRRFSDIENMKSLIYFDASLWLREDKGPQRRRRTDKSFRYGSSLATRFPTTESSDSHALPVAFEPVIREIHGGTTAERNDPVAFEISDDEKPDDLCRATDDQRGQNCSTVILVKKQPPKLLTDKSNSDGICHLISSDNDDIKQSDGEMIDGEIALGSCARSRIYDRSSKRLVEENLNRGIEKSTFLSRKSSENRHKSSASEGLRSRPGPINAPPNDQRSTARKSSDPSSNKFTKSVMLVKKNPTSRDKPEGAKPSSPVILLDIMCNCTWQEHRDPIVGKVYEMVADGQAVAGQSFELQNLLVELMPKSEKELVIPKNIMETTKAADLHVVPIRITKKRDSSNGLPVPSNGAVKHPLVQFQAAKSLASSESPEISLSGMKHFVSGSAFQPKSLASGSNRLATSCTFGPFPLTPTADKVPEISVQNNFRDETITDDEVGKELSDELRLPGDVLESGETIPLACDEQADAVNLDDTCDDNDNAGDNDNGEAKTQPDSADLSARIDPLADENLDKRLLETLEEVVDTSIPGISPEVVERNVSERGEQIVSRSNVDFPSSPPPLSASAATNVVLLPPDDPKMDSSDMELSLMASDIHAVNCGAQPASTVDAEKIGSCPETSCSARPPDSSGQIVLTNSFKMNLQVFDSLPSAASLSGAVSPLSASVGVPSKLIPVSNMRLVAVNAAQRSHISSDSVLSSVPKIAPRISASLVKAPTSSAHGSLLRAPFKPGTLLLAGNSGVTLKPSAPIRVIPPKVIVTSRSSGIAPLAVSSESLDNRVTGKCILVPASKLLRLGVPLGKTGAEKNNIFAQVLKKKVSSLPGQGHLCQSVLSSGVNIVQVKPTISSVPGKPTVTISTSMIPANKPIVSVLSQSSASGSNVGEGRPLMVHSKVEGSNGGDVIEIPDDSDEERCPDVIDVPQAETDGSNEATILREKLGIPLESGASKTEIPETSSQPTVGTGGTGGTAQKKKRKQMHEERTELAMNIEFTESWIALPNDKPEVVSDSKEDGEPERTTAAAAAAAVPAEAIEISKLKRVSKNSANASNSASLELYSGLFRCIAQYLMRSGEMKKNKLSKLYIIRKAIKVVKHLNERNREFVNELVAEKLTNDRLRGRLKALQATDSTMALQKGSHSKSDESPSVAESSSNRPPSEKRKISGPLCRKFRGISRKEELGAQNSDPEHKEISKSDSAPRDESAVCSESTEIDTRTGNVETLETDVGGLEGAETCNVPATTVGDILDSAQIDLPEDFLDPLRSGSADEVSDVLNSANDGSHSVDSESLLLEPELVVSEVVENIVEVENVMSQ